MTSPCAPGTVVPSWPRPRSLSRAWTATALSISRNSPSAQTPTLLWFWAPWCEVCNAEAPAIQRLAETGRDELTVVAIGGRDDLANAPGFVARHRLRTPTLLFDESMAVWRAYRIPGQPGAVLLDRNGRERARWFGPFDTDLALEAARTL